LKLRRRLGLYFAIGTSAILVVSRVATLVSFQQVQEYDLDRGLRARAKQEGNEVALIGRKALEAEYDAQEGEPDPLEQLVTYGALYRADGTLVADTLSFSHAPSLRDIGIDVARGQRPPSDCFDFNFRGSVLRGVLVELGGHHTEGQWLLLAASRRDMDDDARQLLTIGWWVLLAAIPVSLMVAWWFGRRMTRGIEDLASAARRVAEGDLDIAFEQPDHRDDEVIALGTAMSEMVERLKVLLETERRFASHAAHELRSPLTVLRGELELALRRPRSSEAYAGFLRDALDATKSLSNLAEDLLVVARSGSGVTSPSAEEIETISLVEEAIAASRAREPEAPPVEVEGSEIKVHGVRADLVRMIRNLVDNAIAHGKPSTNVHVRVDSIVRSDDGAVFARITVEDDGIGVAPEDRTRVFEHFHRGADARELSGAGLGLGIAREVAVRHGGDLVLAHAGNPTRFVATLPMGRPNMKTFSSRLKVPTPSV
jgi:two-component system, OmpR family, sensor kinase